MPTKAEMLQQIDDSMQGVGDLTGKMPDDADNKSEKEDYLFRAKMENRDTSKVVDIFDDYIDTQEEAMDDLGNIGALSSRNVFNITKVSQYNDMYGQNQMLDNPSGGLGNEYIDDTPLDEGYQEDPNIDSTLDSTSEKFEDAHALKEYIDRQTEGEDTDQGLTQDNIIQHFTSLVSDDSEQMVNDALTRYFEFKGQQGITPQEELTMLEPVFEALPKSMKTPEYSIGENSVQGVPSSENILTDDILANNTNRNIFSLSKVKTKKFDKDKPLKKNKPSKLQDSILISKVVDESNEFIKKIAENHIKINKNSSNKFNMKKLAQHKGFENSFMYGPSEKSVDPFTGMQISDWHLVERNKGFGLVVDDVWNIDWERIWRSTIMDKYSRPYRDKDGNWVGGYIEKRFETDKYIPEGNNYQLKPSELRRNRSPQYGLTEARMEHMRSKNERGYEPTSEGNPTDWNENGYSVITKANNVFNMKVANSKKKVK